MTPTFRRAFPLVATGLAALGLSVGLVGCPGAADLENAVRFNALAGSSSTTTGGTGMGGGAGGMSCVQALPTLNSNCDYRTSLTNYCAKSGCHKPSTLFPRGVADLNLMPDDFLISRLVNEPAAHTDITCESGVGDCVPATCAMFDPVLLVNKVEPAESWIVTKMTPFMPGSTTNTDVGCGDDMPSTNTTFGTPYTANAKACLLEFFQYIAMNGRQCHVETAGAGGGGAGGGGGRGGAASGGAGAGGSPGSGGT